MVGPSGGGVAVAGDWLVGVVGDVAVDVLMGRGEGSDEGVDGGVGGGRDGDGESAVGLVSGRCSSSRPRVHGGSSGRSIFLMDGRRMMFSIGICSRGAHQCGSCVGALQEHMLIVLQRCSRLWSRARGTGGWGCCWGCCRRCSYIRAHRVAMVVVGGVCLLCSGCVPSVRAAGCRCFSGCAG